MHCLNTLVRKEGIKSIYKGWNVSVAGILPYASIEMGAFFTMKDEWMKRHNNAQPPVHMLLAMGATAGFSGAIVTYPFQLIRTKLQAQGMPGRTVTNKR